MEPKPTHRRTRTSRIHGGEPAGTDPNMNRRGRRYLPRYTTVLSVPEASVRCLVDHFNNTPRKYLEWKTPAEVFKQKMLET
ncbi:hypothetical protein [Roseibium algae]|uniref:hypothetical protein n=1 Tax=Roseibium algae TaxID=3123038 RepID=UPI0030EDBE54